MHAHYLNIFWLNLFDFFFLLSFSCPEDDLLKCTCIWWASLFFATSVKFTKRCRLRLHVRFFVVVIFAVILQLLFHFVLLLQFEVYEQTKGRERESDSIDVAKLVMWYYLACVCVCECIPYVMHCSIVQHCDKLMNVDIKYAPWHYYYILFSMFV